MHYYLCSLQHTIDFMHLPVLFCIHSFLSGNIALFLPSKLVHGESATPIPTTQSNAYLGSARGDAVRGVEEQYRTHIHFLGEGVGGC